MKWMRIYNRNGCNLNMNINCLKMKKGLALFSLIDVNCEVIFREEDFSL